jgi:hypothetical protein
MIKEDTTATRPQLGIFWAWERHIPVPHPENGRGISGIMVAAPKHCKWIRKLRKVQMAHLMTPEEMLWKALIYKTPQLHRMI